MRIPVMRIFWILTVITVVILAAHSLMVLSHHVLPQELPEFLAKRFDLTEEANLPSWYATVLLFSVSAVSYLLYKVEDGHEVPQLFVRNFWFGFSMIYAFLSLDEAAQIHEIFDQLSRIKWVFAYAPVVGVLFLLCIFYFVVGRPGRNHLRNWVIIGLVVYALGGLVGEWISYTFEMKYAWRQISFVLEKGCELMGTIIVLTGILQEFDIRFGTLPSR